MAETSTSVPSTAPIPVKKPKKVHVEPALDLKPKADVKGMKAPTPWQPLVEFNFPPYALVRDHNGRFIVAGGGGAGRTGVPNKLVIMKHKEGQVKRVSLFDTSQSAIMNISLHPTEDLLACGAEDKCRIYNIGHRDFTQINDVVTDFAKNPENLGQKRVRFLPHGSCLATSGGDGVVRIWEFPSLELIKEVPAHAESNDPETVDLAVTNHFLVTMTRSHCKVYNILTGQLLHTFSPQKGMSFRDARFSPVETFKEGFKQHSESSKQESGKYSKTDDSEISIVQPDCKYLYITEFKPQKQSIVRKWDVRNWKCIKTATLRFTGDHHTAFSVSPSGHLLAFGTVEGQVRVLNAHTLSEIMRYHTHDFFITDFAFEEPDTAIDKTGNLEQPNKRPHLHTHLISVSGDNTIRTTLIKPKKSLASTMFKYLFVLLLLATFSFTIIVAAMYHFPHETRSLSDFSRDNLGLYHDQALELYTTGLAHGKDYYSQALDIVQEYVGHLKSPSETHSSETNWNDHRSYQSQ